MKGKMKAYSPLVFLIFLCVTFKGMLPIEIKPELKKNILKFGYGINYKYEGMLTHSFERFYVITKFNLPTVEDLKFSMLNIEDKCEYLQEIKGQHSAEKQYIIALVTYCRKI